MGTLSLLGPNIFVKKTQKIGNVFPKIVPFIDNVEKCGWTNRTQTTI